MSLTLSFASGAALVVGGSGGIGAGVVRQLAAAGLPVFLTYHRDAAKAQALKASLEARGSRCEIAQTDVARAESIEPLFAQAQQAVGKISQVIYAAGPAFEFNFISNVPLDEWHRVVDADINGAFHLIRHAAGLFKAQGGGNLVAVITAGVERYPLRDVMSAAPKAAVEMMIRGVAKEYGRYGVRANCVGPGWINAGLGKQALDTKLDDSMRAAILKTIPLQRFGTADEVGHAAAFLCSQQAAFITGQTLMIDGGAQV